jgi:carboxyl-terminal processing protease
MSLSEKRRNNDIEFQFLIEDINTYNDSRNKKYVSLNSEIRKQEKDTDEEKEFQRENERREAKGLKLLDKGEVPEKKEKEDDMFLTETAMIVTDIIELSGRLTEVR